MSTALSPDELTGPYQFSYGTPYAEIDFARHLADSNNDHMVTQTEAEQFVINGEAYAVDTTRNIVNDEIERLQTKIMANETQWANASRALDELVQSASDQGLQAGDYTGALTAKIAKHAQAAHEAELENIALRQEVATLKSYIANLVMSDEANNHRLEPQELSVLLTAFSPGLEGFEDAVAAEDATYNTYQNHITTLKTKYADVFEGWWSVHVEGEPYRFYMAPSRFDIGKVKFKASLESIFDVDRKLSQTITPEEKDAFIDAAWGFHYAALSREFVTAFMQAHSMNSGRILVDPQHPDSGLNFRLWKEDGELKVSNGSSYAVPQHL